MKGSRIAAIAIVGIMIASGFCFLTFNSSNAKAFPTANPQPSEYIFYDDFERTGNVAWPYWLCNQTHTVPYQTVNAFHGAKSLKFDPSDSYNRQILRYFTNDTPVTSTGIAIETEFYDNVSITTGQCDLFLNSATNSWVGLGVRGTTSTTLYSYWVSNAGGAYTYQRTTIQRTTGWHDLSIVVSSNTQFSCFIDSNFVGNITIADTAGMNSYGFIATNPFICYLDQFLIYPFYQYMPWQRVKLALGNTVSFRSYIAGEATLMYEGGIWKMWYNAMNASDMATGGLGYATSTDGYNWTDYNNVHAPLFSLGYYGFRPYVAKIDSTYYVYYTNESVTGHAYAGCHYMRRSSSDGITWSAAVATNLSCGAALGAWDHNHIGNICVWKEDATWYAMYEANSNASTWKTGLATSTDGINWIKSSSNPVTPAGMMAGGPEVHKIGLTYYMLVHGLLTTSTTNTPTDQFLLQSTDLIHWTQCSIFTQIPRLIGDSSENYQVADASYASGGGKNLLAYSGTVSGTNYCQIWIARSDYTLDQIANGQILQSGKHLIGDIGVVNNITAAGTYWYSGINAMKGTYTDNLSLTTTSPINVTLTEMNNVSTSWIADSGAGNPTVQYEVSNLTAGTTYYILVDGSQYGLPQTPINGSISFAYSGGYHQFDVTVYRFGPTLSPLLYLIPLFLTLGIVLIPVMKIVELSKQKRMIRVDEVIRMFVTIVVGFALVGITYIMI